MLLWGHPGLAWTRPETPLDPRALCQKAPGTQGHRCSPGSAEEMDQGLVCWSAHAAVTDTTDRVAETVDIHCLTVLEARSPGSRCRHGWLPFFLTSFLNFYFLLEYS